MFNSTKQVIVSLNNLKNTDKRHIVNMAKIKDTNKTSTQKACIGALTYLKFVDSTDKKTQAEVAKNTDISLRLMKYALYIYKRNKAYFYSLYNGDSVYIDNKHVTNLRAVMTYIQNQLRMPVDQREMLNAEDGVCTNDENIIHGRKAFIINTLKEANKLNITSEELATIINEINKKRKESMDVMQTANVIVQGVIVDTITISPFDIDYYNELQLRYSHPITIGYTYDTMLQTIREEWNEYSTDMMKHEIISQLIDLDEDAYSSNKFDEDLEVAMLAVVSDLECSFISGEGIKVFTTAGVSNEAD